jgi:hypothetical protein
VEEQHPINPPLKTPTILMKTFLLNSIIACSLISCATGPRAQTGAVIGGLGGAAAGGIIGSQSGRGLDSTGCFSQRTKP